MSSCVLNRSSSKFSLRAVGIFVVTGLLLSVLACGESGRDQAQPESAKKSISVLEQPAPLVVYTARKSHLIKPLFDQYARETGTPIKFVTDSAGPLLVRLQAEGKRTPADLLITVDVGNLWRAASKGVLKPLDSPVLEKNIPAAYRDPENRWVGLSLRARTIVYSTERVKPEELSSYEALASPKFPYKLCLRTSKKVYNQSLVAALIQHFGSEPAEEIVKGWVGNLAQPVFSSDTSLIKAIASGDCDVGLVNTYYLGRLLKENPDYPVGLFWAAQSGHGVHVNVSGAGVTRYSKQPVAAQALLEWLSGKEAQESFAASNLEFPVLNGVPVDPVIAAWGEYKADTLATSVLGELQSSAVRIMDRAGYR